MIEGSGIRRCEIDHLAENELIVILEMLVSQDTFKNNKGLFEAFEKLFDDKARAKYDEYFTKAR